MSTDASGVPALDLHNHSNFSDGQLPPEAVAQTLAAQGLRGGLADHALIHGRLRTAADFALYYAAADRSGLYRGLEVDLGVPLTWPLRVLDEADYLIGSLHALIIGGEEHSLINYFNHRLGYKPDYRPDPVLANRDRLLEAALAAFRQGLDDWPIDILGHCTLLPGLEDDVPEDWAEALIGLAVQRGAAIEISGLWRLPGEVFLRRALERGATFSLGSDGHTKGTYGEIAYCREMIRRVGIPAERMFTPGPRRPRK